MPEADQSFRAKLAFVALFAALAVGIVVAGYAYYLNYEERFRTEVEEQLLSVADLKVSDLMQYRKERLGDASILANNPAISALVRRVLKNSPDADAQSQLEMWLRKFQDQYDYDVVRLLDPQGNVRVSSSVEASPPSAQLTQRAAEVLRSGQVDFLDFHRHSNQRIYLDVLAPIIDEKDASRPLGVIALRIDPERYLYPFINRWPTPSETAETLLVRRDGDDVLFLSELRFRKSTALSLRIPLTRADVPAVMAVQGEDGIVEGRDYRGAPVVAAVRIVPDSPWFLEARMETAEVYAPIRKRLWQVLSVMGLTIFGAGTSVGYVWRQQRARFYRERYETTKALQESERFLVESQKAAGIGSYILDLSAGMWKSSGILDEIFGIDAAVVRSVERWVSLVHPDDRRAMNEYFAVDVVQKRGRFDREYRIVRMRDVATRWVHGLGELEFDAGHRPIRMTGTIQDITARKLAEEALRESEERLYRAVRNAPFPVMIHAENGEVVLISEAWTEIAGYTHAEISTIADWTEKAYGVRRQLVQEEINNLYGLTAKHKEGDYVVRTKSGDQRIWDFMSSPLGRLADGRRMVVSMAMDVTERRKTDDALRESERFLRESQKAAGVGSYILDLGVGTWKSSSVLDEIFGIDTAYDHSVRGWTALMHPDWREVMVDHLTTDVIQKQGSFDKEYQIIRQRDGATRWVHGMGELEFDAGQRPVRMVGTIQDITERKRAEEIVHVRLRLMDFAAGHSLEELLQQTLEEVESLADSTVSFYHFVEPDQKTLSLQAWSKRTLRDYCTAEGKGRHYHVAEAGVWVDCIHQRRAVIHNDYAALPHRKGLPEGHSPLVRELVVPIFRQNLIVAVLGVGNKHTDYTEKDIETITFIADVAWEIAERVRQDRELREKNAELERFTYTVSHDLKSPLITIKGFAGALLSDVTAGRHQRLEGDLRRVTEAADKMSDLLTDLLELSRVGRIMQPPTDVNLDHLLREVLRLLAGPIANRHAEILLQSGLPIVSADRHRLGEVWQNLIENALKFTGEQPQLRIEIASRGPDASRVFFVRDNGAGIDPRYHETVFGLFNKLDTRTEGTGIGLALVRRIIEVHGGRIWVESEGIGHGSTFCFTLPTAKSTQQPKPI